MAFWGVEIKPKKSFTLNFFDFEGPRLHLSQATLGSRKSDERTIVKCSVANSPALYLCSLLPGTVETCSLDLYFDQDVTFSVKGSTSVHLVGYFEGSFDGNESGEDVEEDGYSDEEDVEDSDDNSLDGFIVSEDEDAYDDEDDYDDEDWSSEEDVPKRPRKSGVTIEELLPDESPLHASKKKVENQERSLVPHKGSKQQETNEVSKDSAQCHAHTNGNGNLKHVTDNFKMAAVEAVDKGASSSEDEDGFHVKRKRKIGDNDNEQPSKRMSTSVHAEETQPVVAPSIDHEVDTDMKGSSEKKKKKKKKKKSKNSIEAVSTSPVLQMNGSLETPSKQGDSTKKEKVESTSSKSSVQDISSKSGVQDASKKGTVRKYANGLEIENTSMGKPDGKQATPGKKVGMIYTGRLRSNGKIFDSNVGNKPFYFRLGVGEVIKGWDIGVNGMRVGDKRQLTIPPNMAYGSKGVQGIPPNSWLVFTVELVEVK